MARRTADEPTPRATLARAGVGLLALGATVVLAVAVADSTSWLGVTSPGFFVMPNRVVASVALGSGARAAAAEVVAREVVAVEDTDVTSPEDVYARVRAYPPGTALKYTVRDAGGSTTVVALPSHRFSGVDYATRFGPVLATGTAFLVAGLWVAFLAPARPAAAGLLALGLAAGLWLVTALDPSARSWIVRVHVAAECLLVPALVHLALVFPTERLGRRRNLVLALVYVAGACAVVAYEGTFAQPAAYATAHLGVSAARSVAAIALLAVVVHDLLRSAQTLVRARAALAVLAAVATVALPDSASAILPLCLGWAVATTNVFAIDRVLRRVVVWTIVVAVVATASIASVALATRAPPHESALLLAVANLAIVLGALPLRSYVERFAEHLLARTGYDARRALDELELALATAHTVPRVATCTTAALDRTVRPAAVGLFVFEPASGQLRPMGGGPTPTLPTALRARIGCGEVVARYEWEDGSGRTPPAVWTALDAALLVPVRVNDATIAVLALGPTARRRYRAEDVEWLQTVARRLGVALEAAHAFDALERTNAGLEVQVRERAAAMVKAHVDLAKTASELRRAYAQLERTQAGLMRADRLATLGRLAAGLAHELDAPLAGVRDAFAQLADLARAYAATAGDPAVGAEDHRARARELEETAASGAAWANRAGAYVDKVTLHAREPDATTAAPFAVATVVREIDELLAHRLRLSSCSIEFADEGAVTVVGDGGRLGQVLVNLVVNAVEAYEDRGVIEGRIEIRARRSGDVAVVTVRDWAGGMPPEVAARIFDDRFTTKAPGRGTGLGLWIARNLVEQRFGGTLTVDTRVGVGSCFTLTLRAMVASESTAA